jgi:hypothetical protein
MEAQAPPRYELPLSPRRLPRLLAAVVSALLAIHVAFQLFRFSGREIPFDLYLPFDVDQEPSVPTWYSAAALLLVVLLLLVIARAKRLAGDRDTRYWFALAIGFTWLSLDEVAAFHELFNTYSSVDWSIPGAIVGVLVGVVFFPFLRRLPSRTRRRFLVAGALFLIGATGFERLANLTIPMETLADKLMVAAEEGLEMFAVVIFIGALLSYMSAESSTPVPVAVRAAEETGGAASRE